MDPVASVIVNAVITNVGGTGYYDDVVDMIDGVDMNCPSFDDACVKEVGGLLVSFGFVAGGSFLDCAVGPMCRVRAGGM